jgi:hypothetical protein
MYSIVFVHTGGVFVMGPGVKNSSGRWPKIPSGSWSRLVSAGTAISTFVRSQRPAGGVGAGGSLVCHHLTTPNHENLHGRCGRLGLTRLSWTSLSKVTDHAEAYRRLVYRAYVAVMESPSCKECT